MNKRDLSLIGFGNKSQYDTFPHTRKALAALRDLALNEQELARVAAMADKFDAEDSAWLEAGMAIRRAMGDKVTLRKPGGARHA